ncbi:MAG: hypothetical protein NC907_02810 [Candidatus Omnitrophica bacterium]|nr:hypothetical protein [Candidatus Omnitrophota bacterium]
MKLVETIEDPVVFVETSVIGAEKNSRVKIFFENKNLVKARGKLENDIVVVGSGQARNPICNLYNKEWFPVFHIRKSLDEKSKSRHRFSNEAIQI